MRIELKNDAIINIVDDSWTENHRTDLTDFGDSTYTNLTFVFENQPNYELSSTTGWTGFRSLNIPGITAFEVTVWLLEHAEELKEMTVYALKQELSKLSGSYYKDAYKAVRGKIIELRSQVFPKDNFYNSEKILLELDGKTLRAYVLNAESFDNSKNPENWKGSFIAEVSDNNFKKLEHHALICLKHAWQDTSRTFYISELIEYKKNA